MPVAAVPKYLGDKFDSASPGMRFGMYLAVWTNRADQEHEINQRAEKRSPEAQALRDALNRDGMEATIERLLKEDRLPSLWQKNDCAAKDAWSKVSKITPDDRIVMKSLNARMGAVAAAYSQDSLLCLHARATAPFTTGLGNEHPLENGFAFLWPYGLPYLAGSGVKGVLRQAARELAGGDWGETRGWSSEKDIEVDLGRDKLGISMLDALFGLESEDGGKEHLRGALSFWDVIPRVEGDSLMVEIMNPHQGHYYQKQNNNDDIIPPHDSGQPVPIYFLTLPPGSEFTFYVTCDLTRLQRYAPALARDGRWKELVTEAFEHAFTWLGFGAKTAVGYGAMVRDRRAEQEAEEAQKQQAEAARRAAMSEEERCIEDLRALFERDKARGALQPNGEVNEQRLKLLEAAAAWEDERLRRRAGELLREIARELPWSKKRKQEATAQVRRLLGEEP